MNVLIMEDEPIIAQRHHRLLLEYYNIRPDLHQGREKICATLEDGLDHLEDNHIDLLLLDLNLRGEDGFEILKQFSTTSFHTIIISAYADFAIHAFEYGVLDFVAKPYDKVRFFKALDRAHYSSQRTGQEIKAVAIKRQAGLEMIPCQNILWLQADGHYTQIHCTDGKEYLHEKSIEKLLQLLPDNFIRTHRSYAVNLHYAHRINIAGGGKYSLEVNDVAVPVSRSLIQSIKDKMQL